MHTGNTGTTKPTARVSLLRRLTQPVDLTAGTPWRVILRYAVPIIISYLLQQIYVLTDAIICGQVLSAEEVAGVNDTFPLTFIFLQFAFGCTAGFSVLTANCVGAGDMRGVRRSLIVQIDLSLVISALLTGLSIALLPWMLGLINVTPTNQTVYHAAYTYCLIIFAGILAQMGYNFICGILRALGDSVTPLVFLIFSTVLNVGLDVLLLIPLDMGPAGAAIATVMAQFVSMIGCFAYTMSRYPHLRPSRADWGMDSHSLLSHLRQGLPLGMQFSILAIGIIVMQGAVVRFDIADGGLMVPGTPAQNGFSAANKLINFLMALYNGLASAILGFNAQNFGKSDYRRIRQGTGQSLLIMLVMYVFCLLSGLLLSVNGTYQHIFLSEDKISASSVQFGNTYLYVDFILYFILGFLIVIRSAVQGIGKVGYVFGAGIAELISRVLICAFLPALVNGGETNASASMAAFAAVCLGDPGAWFLASLVLLVPTVRYIFRMRYKHDLQETDNSGHRSGKSCS